MVHDPLREMSYVQQCLSQSKKPLGLFLGAGCATSIKVNGEQGSGLIPDMGGITEVVRCKLSDSQECGPLLKCIEGHFVKDGQEGATVEDMLSHIRALRAVAGREKARDLTAEELDKLDNEICEIIHAVANKSLPNTETPYHWIATWIESTERMVPVEVFTTNYDLLMEQAFEDCKVPYFDGFAGSCRPFFDVRAVEEDRLPERWARLWKLHGSINWYQDASKGVFRGGVSESGLRRVIHPSHLKYEESRRMPYLAMMDRLRAFLRQPSAALVLCGYSFRDDHINEVIVQGLKGTQSAIAFGLLFGNVASYSQGASLAAGCSNLSLLAKDGAVVGGIQAGWGERDAESVESDSSGWVSWSQVDATAIDSRLKAEFHLGDFVVLGEFVHEVVGRVQQRTEVG